MKIFKDKFTGEEMFSDAYKIQLIDDVLYEVYGKLEIRKQGEIYIEGSNPSAEEAEETSDSTTTSGVDIVLNHRLEEFHGFTSKKSYMLFLKDYMKKLTMSWPDDEKMKAKKTAINEIAKKKILDKYNDLQFYMGANMSHDGGYGMLEYRDIDGKQVPVMMFFKDGLEEEKF